MNPMQDLLDSDLDPTETQEWIDALRGVIDADGAERAHFLLDRMVETTRRAGAVLPFDPTTEYINTIPPQFEAKSDGDAALEWRIRSIIRWNAMAMVVRANRKPGDLGGHIASFASSATLYDVGFNHFFRGADGDHPGDLVAPQGHSSPGIYARAFLEGRISESQLDNFRMEVDGRGVLGLRDAVAGIGEHLGGVADEQHPDAFHRTGVHLGERGNDQVGHARGCRRTKRQHVAGQDAAGDVDLGLFQQPVVLALEVRGGFGRQVVQVGTVGDAAEVATDDVGQVLAPGSVVVGGRRRQGRTASTDTSSAAWRPTT